MAMFKSFNKSQLTSEIYMLHELSVKLEIIGQINMYATFVFMVIGLIGNMSALGVLVYGRNKMPRIIGVNYFIMLTLINTSYLLLHFYMSTLVRFIHYFDLVQIKSFHYMTASNWTCKILMYLRYMFRLLNTAMTVTFSLERLLAVYSPLTVRSFDFKCSPFFKIFAFICILIPSYSLFLFEIVPADSYLNEDYRLTMGFSLKTLIPAFNNQICSANNQKIRLLFKWQFITFFTIFFSYLVVSLSILAIIVKLRKANQFKFKYESNKNSDANSVVASVKKSEEETPKLQVCNKASSSSRENDIESESAMLPPHRDSNPRKTRRVTLVITNKMYDTRMLSSISLSYAVLNTPYFIGIMILMVSFIVTDDLNLSLPQNLAFRFRLQKFILIGEIFMLVNFSVTGPLLYFYGQVYRIHAVNILKKIFNCLK